MFCMKYMVTARIFIFWMVHDKKKQLFASTCVSQNDLMKKMPVCTYLYIHTLQKVECSEVQSRLWPVTNLFARGSNHWNFPPNFYHGNSMDLIVENSMEIQWICDWNLIVEILFFTPFCMREVKFAW